MPLRPSFNLGASWSRSGQVVPALFALGGILSFGTLAAQELLERLDESLTFATDDGTWRGRVSGTLDLEAYHFSGIPPGLIDTRRHDLFSPRFTFFFDGQIG